MLKGILLPAISLTLISFVFLTKWWLLDIVDGGNEIAHGFPMVQSIRCFHTSLCTQIFVKAYLVNLATYLTFWCLLLYLAKRIYRKLAHKYVVRAIHITASVLMTFIILFSFVTERVYTWESDFQWNVLDSGLETFFTLWGDSRQ